MIHSHSAQWKNVISKPVLVLISFYLLGLAALFYSPDKAEGFNILGRQLAIFLFPILFAVTDLDIEKYRANLVCIFGLTCTATVLYLYADAVRTIFYFQLPFSSLFTLVFMNHNFSMPLGIHATYLSVYVAFSLLAFLYLLIEKKGPGRNWIYIACILVLSAGLVQLSSRATFIAFMIIVNGVFPFVLFRRRKRVLFLASASFITLATMLMIYNVDSFKTRYISELKTDLTGNAKLVENTEPRLARWKAMWELVKASPVVGYGTGSEKKLLKDKYYEKGLYISYLNEFNTHSQYLGILLRAGMIGLALFIYILYFGFARALREQDVLFLVFMVIVAVVCVSENFLDLNNGVFFYGFFFPAFLFKTRYRKKKE